MVCVCVCVLGRGDSMLVAEGVVKRAKEVEEGNFGRELRCGRHDRNGAGVRRG